MNIINIFLIAIGLSMDTFSLSLAYGMIINNNKTIIKLSLAVGVFHFFMPLIGSEIGKIIIETTKVNPEVIESIIFFSIAIELILSLFKEETPKVIEKILSIIIFSFAVSIDSFIVGIGIKGVTNGIYVAFLIFMTVSAAFTFTGLFFGNKIKKIIGNKALIIGITILLFLSIKYILNVIAN